MATLSPPLPVLADPAFDKGALGDEFTPTVADRKVFKEPHERDTADYLADKRGRNVHARREVYGQNEKNPDAMVRRDRDDPGTITEFKRPMSGSYNSFRKNLRYATAQVHAWGGGDVVIDGRVVGMTERLARQHCDEALAEARRKSEPLPSEIHVILGDGEMITMKGK